jgi:hypothetical protein
MIILSSIVRCISKFLAGVLYIHPTIVVVGPAIEDLESQCVISSNTALDDLGDVFLTDVDIRSLGRTRTVSFHLTNADANT